jgi:hypothetical protein
MGGAIILKVSIVAFLIEKGASVNAFEMSDPTPLHYAAQS